MPGTATRYLDLVFKINTTSFNNAYTNVIQKVNNLKAALKGLSAQTSNMFSGSGRSSAVSGANSIASAINNTTKATQKFGRSVVQTRNSLRAYGDETGFLKVFAIARSNLLLAAFAFGGVVAGIKSSIDAAMQMQSALIGLSAIATRTTGKINETKEAALTLASKGFMSVSEAATGLKNLLATGFNLEQSVTLMNRFADSAAFNRQAAFEWGEAITRTTEGIRLGLSNVADAGGMLKNLSQILEENGKSQKDVMRIQSDASVRQALYNGILKETNLFLGNADLALGEYQGSISKLNVSLFNLKASIGDALIKSMSSGIGVINDTVEETYNLIRANKELIALNLSDIVSEITNGFEDLLSVLKFLGGNNSVLKFITTDLIYIASLFTTAKVAARQFGESVKLTFSSQVWIFASITVAVELLRKFNDELTRSRQLLLNYNAEGHRATAERLAEIRTIIQQKESYKTLLEEKNAILENIKKTRGLSTEEIELQKHIAKEIGNTTAQLKFQAELLKRMELREFIEGIRLSMFQQNMGSLETLFPASSDLFKQVNNFYSLGKKEKLKVIEDLKLLEVQAREKNIPVIKQIIAYLQKANMESINLLSPPPEQNNDRAEAMKRWLEALRNYQQKTAEIAAPEGYATVTQKAKNEIEDLIKLAKDAGAKITPEIQKIFDVGLNTRQLEYNTEQIKKFFEAQSKVAANHAKQQKEWNDNARKEEFDLRADFFKKLEDLEKDFASSRMSSYDKEIYNLDQLLNEFEMFAITLPAVANQLNIVKDIITKMKEQIERTKLLDYAKQWQDIFSPVSQAAEDVFVNIRQEERDTIESLKKELEKGTIDQQEYLARVDLAHRNAAINIQNAWNSAGRNIAMGMFNYFQQIIMTALQTKTVVESLKTAFNPASIALGLGLAAVGAGMSVLTANTFKEKATLNYEDISPNVSDTKRRTYGSISAASPMYINVTPTVNIEGQTVLIGSGSITEFEAEASEMIKNTIQMGLNNNEFNLAGLSPA